MKKSKLVWGFAIFLITIWLSLYTVGQTVIFPDTSTDHSITIIDNWGGLNPVVPKNALYILGNPKKSTNHEQFQGSIPFSVGEYWSDLKKEPVWLSSHTVSQTVIFPDISTVYSITIIDNWVGLSPVAPINSLYILGNYEKFIDHEQIQGSAFFSVGGYRSDTQKETVQISVPKDVIQAFLQKLSQVSLENSEYKPFAEWTDDYPEITIQVFYGNGETIEFYTSSQGDEHTPWKVTYNGESYVVNSGLPMQALEMLNDYLAQDVLNNLMEQVEKQADL